MPSKPMFPQEIMLGEITVKSVEYICGGPPWGKTFVRDGYCTFFESVIVLVSMLFAVMVTVSVKEASLRRITPPDLAMLIELFETLSHSWLSIGAAGSSTRICRPCSGV